MIDLSEVTFRAGQPIDGYGAGFFRLSQSIHEGPLAILPRGVRAWTGFPDVAPFLAEKDSFDVLLIGTGAEIAPLPAEMKAALAAADVGADVMATGPACRTYNVLLAEDRRVALAVLPV